MSDSPRLCPNPNCQADLDGGSIWETGLIFAQTGRHYSQKGIPAKSQEEAERLADDYAEAYGATRTKGRWGRAILMKPEDNYQCPDCKHLWPAPWAMKGV